MKKVIIAIAIIATAILMVYLTKPRSDIGLAVEQTTNPQAELQNHAEVSRTPPQINAKIEELKCNQKALLAELDSIKATRDEQIKALINEGVDAKHLSEMVRVHANDHVLANQISPPKPLNLNQNKSPDVLALEELQKNSEVIEDMMLAVWAGESEEVINQFMKGEIQHLKPTSEHHKQFLLNMISMSGNNQMVTAVSRLYGDTATLNPQVAASIIQAVDDPKALKALLSRVTDLNQKVNHPGRFFESSNPTNLVKFALQNNKLEAINVLLELGVKANEQDSKVPMNFFFNSNPTAGDTIARLLDRGFFPHNADSAKRLSHSLQEGFPQLASRISSIEAQLIQQKEVEFANLPANFKEIIKTYDQQYNPLEKQYFNCIAEASEAKPKIPEYQPIDEKQIEKLVDQLVEQKVDYQQIVSSLGAINKESVEYGYRYLARLRNKSYANNQMEQMPAEVRTLISLLRKEDWSGMVDFMQKTEINSAWNITPGNMISVMLEKNAPESAIAAMAKISDKNDTQLLGQALHNPELLRQIVGYGFNLNAKDQKNKNLLYHAVKINSVEKIDFLIENGVSFQPDPYGYDALDMVLRQRRTQKQLFEKLHQVGFPITPSHLDYSLYLKTHYPERYQEIIEAMPNLEVTGTWDPKS